MHIFLNGRKSLNGHSKNYNLAIVKVNHILFGTKQVRTPNKSVKFYITILTRF